MWNMLHFAVEKDYIHFYLNQGNRFKSLSLKRLVNVIIKMQLFDFSSRKNVKK